MTAHLDDPATEVALLDVPVEPVPTSERAVPAEAATLSPIGLTVLLLGAFLPILDFFIVNVALPTMDATLHASAPMLELVIAGYGTAYALGLVVGGRLGDALGRRRLFVIGLGGFTLTSLLCGVAPNIGVLIAARIAQGLSAALSQPQVLATIQSTLAGSKRVRAISLYASVGGVAASVGQLLGGALVQADIAGTSWRPIFLVNVPVGLLVLGLTRRFVPATRSPDPAGVDLPGTALLGIAIVALLIPLTEGRSLHWPLWTWLVLALAPISAAAMAMVERRGERAGRVPLIPPSLVRLASVRRGLLLAVPFFMGFGAFMFVFALTVQDGLGAGALHSGVLITPMAVAFFGATLVAPRMLSRYGRYTVTAGLGLQAVGLSVLVLVMTSQWPHVNGLALAPGLAIAGVGQAFGLVGLFRTVLADIPGQLAGIGSGMLVTVQQGALALGVAGLGSLFVSLADTSMRTAFAIVVCVQIGIAVLVALASLRLPDPR